VASGGYPRAKRAPLLGALKWSILAHNVVPRRLHFHSGLRHFDVNDAKLPGPDACCGATIASCTERTFEQHDFDGCPTPQLAGRLNVGYFQVETRPFVL
jgi:hypothetical protein